MDFSIQQPFHPQYTGLLYYLILALNFCKLRCLANTWECMDKHIHKHTANLLHYFCPISPHMQSISQGVCCLFNKFCPWPTKVICILKLPLLVKLIVARIALLTFILALTHIELFRYFSINSVSINRTKGWFWKFCGPTVKCITTFREFSTHPYSKQLTEEVLCSFHEKHILMLAQISQGLKN